MGEDMQVDVRTNAKSGEDFARGNVLAAIPP